MTMTKKDALTIALNTLTADSYNITYKNVRFGDGHIGDATETVKGAEVREVLSKMIAQLSKPHTPKSEEAKAKANALRKEKTAAARAELVAKVAPILREGLSHTLEGLTAKELFAEVADKLPEDFTALKVQNVLLRDMREELVITEAKGKANTYALKSVVG